MTAEPSSDTGRIVVGIDGSPSSLDALVVGGPPGRPHREPPGDRDDVGVAVELRLGRAGPRRLRSRVGHAARRSTPPSPGCAADHPGLQVDPRLISGHPAPILVEASKGADLLVVGSRGHGEFVGMLIGSVSEYCATNAHCPVLIHRAPQR